MKPKKMMLSLACGHTVILDRRDASSAMNGGGMSGTHYSCPKCPPFSERRIVERSWVDDQKGG